MRSLALDTSLAACSAAVAEDGVVLRQSSSPMARGQAEAIIPLVSSLLQEIGSSMQTIDTIAVTTGPGSFTGVRVGLAAAAGLAAPFAAALIAVPTAEAVALSCGSGPAQDRLVVALDGGRADVFVAVFERGIMTGDYLSLLPEDVPAHLPQAAFALAGNGADKLRPVFGREKIPFEDTGIAFPDPGILALAAFSRAPAPSVPRPIYLHPPYAVKPARGGSLL